MRPAWLYNYQAIAEGHWLDSHTEGSCRVVIQDAVSGVVLKESPCPLWNFDNDRWEQQDGYVDSWALGASVFIQAGQIFIVSFLANAMVVDSGSGYFFSFARVNMEMRVPFLVAELGPK